MLYVMQLDHYWNKWLMPSNRLQSLFYALQRDIKTVQTAEQVCKHYKITQLRLSRTVQNKCQFMQFIRKFMSKKVREIFIKCYRSHK